MDLEPLAFEATARGIVKRPEINTYLDYALASSLLLNKLDKRRPVTLPATVIGDNELMDVGEFAVGLIDVSFPFTEEILDIANRLLVDDGESKEVLVVACEPIKKGSKSAVLGGISENRWYGFGM